MSFGPAFKAIFKFHRIMLIVTPWLILGGYWVFLFVLTHLPATRLPAVQVMGKDRTMHYLAYLGLGLVFWLCYYRDMRPSFRQKRTWLMVFTLVAYGAFDEITQKYFGRTTDVMDLMFDSFGIMTSLVMLFFIRRLIHWLFIIWAVLFIFSHWPSPTHFIELPKELNPLKPLGYMAGYFLVTVLWWRCLSPKNKFMVNKYIFAWTAVIMVAYSVFDQFIMLIMRKGFSSEALTTALMSVFIGIVVSCLFGLQNQAEENYQKYVKHIEEQDGQHFNGLYDDGLGY